MSAPSRPSSPPRARRSPPAAALIALIREVVARGGHLEIVAVGGSMAPAIAPGDRLLLSPLRAGEPRLGQVAVWARAGKLVAHRVVARDADAVVTRGDASAQDDPRLDASELLAVVRRVRRPWKVRLRRAVLSVRAAVSRDRR